MIGSRTPSCPSMMNPGLDVEDLLVCLHGPRSLDDRSTSMGETLVLMHTIPLSSCGYGCPAMPDRTSRICSRPSAPFLDHPEMASTVASDVDHHALLQARGRLRRAPRPCGPSGLSSATTQVILRCRCSVPTISSLHSCSSLPLLFACLPAADGTGRGRNHSQRRSTTATFMFSWALALGVGHEARQALIDGRLGLAVAELGMVSRPPSSAARPRGPTGRH